MNATTNGIPYRGLRWIALGAALLVTLLLLGLGGTRTAAHPAAPPTTPIPQQFQDVPNSNPFSAYVNALAVDHVIAGYTCGGAGEPCIPPGNLPYYRPNNLVTRSQMAKFVDNGRKNISDAVGHSLSIITDAYTAIEADTTSGGYGVRAQCTLAGTDCYALEGHALGGDYAAYLYGGRGTYSEADDNDYPGVFGQAYGTTAGSYGGDFASDNYNALRVEAPPAPNGRAQAFISGTAGNLYAVDIDPGAIFVNGNLNVTGSKSGYVVDAMQNLDSSPLEPGDVVVIVGHSAPVAGNIPVITVKKATTANDSGVVGIVDQALYVPDAATRAAYEAQQQAIRDAEQRRNAALAAAAGTNQKPVDVPMPAAPITDVQGLPHATDATSIPSGSYANVVTLGSYQAVKVDAGFGAIHAGDLLTTSPHAGYAMKVTDKVAALGAVIGKATGDLESGTGTVPVMVTLK